ncbi:AfsR/SARP family transcriptional regulator [Streptomyces sp. ADI95-16]|uniref:AfsR/SARP family transcriptional regulator n=1 Tax=Streptomyces sp. ADI95-16 TaxID=1522758 RepID=UPI0020B2FD64|nr:AfsR/SARP family transcriptional regulator [Streptomyces sp. ADI95-16]
MSIAHGPETVVLKPSKPTSLLAALLLHPNSVVSTTYLLRAVWDEEPPATARAALQTCVLRLRRLFAKYGISATTIEAVPGGYRMRNDTETLDLVLFRTLTAGAGSATGPGEELYRLREALSLWHGQPLANVASRMLQQDAVPALEQERLRVLERVCDLELAAGNCHQVLVDLYEGARRHPVRERFTEQLIEALYRTGRQAEALAEYRTVRDRLRDELGIDPGPGLRRLELAILRSEDLAPAPPTPPSAPARALTGAGVRALPPRGAPAHGRRPRREVPPVPAFAGRENARRAIAERLTCAEGPRLVVVSGAPGIGKSALARQTAHETQHSFPGGVFVLALARPDGTPLTVEEAARLLPEAGAGTGADRQLIVLDDAAGAWQVTPLLPAAGDASVVVTSRRALAAVVATHGGAVHRLDVLRPAEAYGLLAGLIGARRIAAEPAAARELASVCGHFPLALRIAAGRLLTRPALSVADCAAWLAADPPARLALAEDARLSVPEVFGQALDALAPDLREAFLRLGGPGADGDPSAGESETVLEQLVDSGLLEDGPPGPYRVHDFLRVYARWHVRTHRTTAAAPAAAAPR